MANARRAALIAFASSAVAALIFGTLVLAGGTRSGDAVVNSTPAGASLYVDGVFRGTTPASPFVLRWSSRQRPR